jgi:dihydrolipoamide dehydrogenase
VLVIGCGPGGHAATIRAAQLGLKALCVEKEDLLGGTCLREGCIWSKVLLNVANKYHELQTEFSSLGIEMNISSLSIDLAKSQKRKKAILMGLSKGIEYLLSKNKAELVKGTANVVSNN